MFVNIEQKEGQVNYSLILIIRGSNENNGLRILVSEEKLKLICMVHYLVAPVIPIVHHVMNVPQLHFLNGAFGLKVV